MSKIATAKRIGLGTQFFTKDELNSKKMESCVLILSPTTEPEFSKVKFLYEYRYFKRKYTMFQVRIQPGFGGYYFKNKKGLICCVPTYVVVRGYYVQAF